MEIVSYIFITVSGILIFFLVFPFLKVFFSLFTKEKLKLSPYVKVFDYGCIITAYRNADIAKGLVQSLLKQSYATHHIYLVADNCDLSNWNFQHEKLTVLKPEPALNLKAKSIIHGIENFVRAHDFCVVFDADNLAHPNFLKEINRYANAGYLSIQGQRTAKNLDTPFACADALGEFYKNYTERLAPYLLGSSAVISGSGMAVETELYKAYLASPEIEQGKLQWKKMLQEDKILQNFLLRQNRKIAYARNALCYDEKVTNADGVETQRSRWLFSYFQNLPNSLGILRRAIANFSWNQWLFGLITIAPPMFILLFLAAAMAVAGYFFMPEMAIALLAAMAIFCGNIFWALELSKAPRKIYGALLAIPGFVWRQVKGLLKMGNPDKNFKHTEHTRSVSIEEVLK